MSRTICQAIDYGGTAGGSFIPAIASLARATTGRGDRFFVLARDVPGAEWGFDLERAGATVQFVHSHKELTDALQRIAPDLVHSHHNLFDLSVLRAPANPRIFWHARSHRENVSIDARARAILKYRVFGKRVERLVAVSKAIAEECIAFAAPPNWVHVVQNGIDTERFRPPEPHERAAARAAFGIHESDRVVLFFERVPYKGGATLRLALKELPELRLLVVGGTKADRDLFGAPPRIISIDTVMEPRDAYWAADVLAFASENEAFGFVIAEGLACGLPLAASDIPAVREICADSDQVAIFPLRDGPAMAAALKKMIGRRSLSGRERIIKHFSLERWTADILHLYDTPPH
jgi:glycosyltransferase involved in cell wall biosynthesis